MEKHLLLLHGALGSAQQVDGLKDHLKEKYHLHSFNFEGHGGRSSSRDFRMDGFGENVLAYMEEKGIAKAHVFGYSMGGYVALNLALKHPEKLEKIITLGTKFDWSEKSTAKEVKMLNPTIIEEKVPKYALHLQKVHHPNDWKTLLGKTAEMMIGLSQGGKLEMADFERIHNQVKVCVGELDKMVRQDFSEEVSRTLPNASFAILPQTPHPFQKVDLKLLAQTVGDFLG